MTFALHACFVESTVSQVTCLRFGTILLLAELLPQKHGCLQSRQSDLFYFCPPHPPLTQKRWVFFWKWREQFSTHFLFSFFWVVLKLVRTGTCVLRGRGVGGTTRESEYKRAPKSSSLACFLKSCRDLPTRDIFSSEHWLLGISCRDETDGGDAL